MLAAVSCGGEAGMLAAAALGEYVCLQHLPWGTTCACSSTEATLGRMLIWQQASWISACFRGYQSIKVNKELAAASQPYCRWCFMMLSVCCVLRRRCAVYVQDICSIITHIISRVQDMQHAQERCTAAEQASSSGCVLAGLSHSIYNMVGGGGAEH